MYRDTKSVKEHGDAQTSFAARPHLKVNCQLQTSRIDLEASLDQFHSNQLWLSRLLQPTAFSTSSKKSFAVSFNGGIAGRSCFPSLSLAILQRVSELWKHQAGLFLAHGGQDPCCGFAKVLLVMFTRRFPGNRIAAAASLLRISGCPRSFTFLS